MRILLTFVFTLATSLSAGITVLEQSLGMIRLKLTADPIVDRGTGDSIALGTFADVAASDSRGREIPALALSIFTQHPEKATVTVTATKKAVITYGRPLRRADSSAVVINGISSPIQTSIYRHSPLHTWLITPVLFAENGMIEQFVEAEAVIRYVPISGTVRPVGDYEEAVASMALNPKEFYRNKPTYSRAVSSDQVWLSPTETALKFTVGGKAGTEQETSDGLDRLIKITPDLLKTGGLGSGLAIGEVVVYASNPAIHSDATPAVDKLPSSLNRIPLIRRDLNNNGIFDGFDEILFFAMGTNSWQKESSRWEFSYNDFTEKRNFYIARGIGSLATKASLPAGGTVVHTTGLQLHAVRQSVSLKPQGSSTEENSSRRWIWQSLNKGSQRFSISTPFPIIGSAPGTTARLKLVLDGYEASSGTVGKFRFHPSKQVVTASPGTFNFESQWVSIPADAERFEYETEGLINSGNYINIKGYDLRYELSLDMAMKKLIRFYSSDSSLQTQNVTTYQAKNLPAEFTAIYRIHSGRQKIELVDTLSAGGTFSWSDSTAVGYQYVIVSASGATVPTVSLENGTMTAPRQYQIRDLHAATNQSDYMIVTPPDFFDEAVRLANHKVAIGQFSHPTIVMTDDIYREFSGGIAYPAAIRNYMMYVMNHWSGGAVPSYLMLFGTGHYDYKGIKSSAPNYIPPYLSYDEKAWNEYHLIEDFYAFTTQGTSTPSFSVGRVPAFNRSELSAYLEKLFVMEDSTGDYSEWRNRVALLSDDDFQEGKIEEDTIFHWVSSDQSGDTILRVAPTVNLKKINLFEYPVEGLKKTAARDGLINLINDGVSWVNYFGHGSPTRMADEYLFDIADVGSLKNYRRYMIFSAFSCSVGFFDLPGTRSLAGKLLTEEGKGAVVSIASTRKSSATANTRSAYILFNEFFTPGNRSVGMAHLKAKQKAYNETYALFGDPSYRPISDNRTVVPVVATDLGVPTDTIRGGQNIFIKAALPVVANVDSVRVQLQMPTQYGVNRKDGWVGYKNWSYSLPGKMICNKPAGVTGDSILVKLYIPPFASSKIDNMQLRLYGWKNGKSKTVTGLTTVTYDGVDASKLDTTDKTGPSVVARLYHDVSLTDTTLPGVVGNRIVINGFPKSDTDLVARPVTVELFFRDSSGVDVIGDQAGDGITVAVPGIRRTKSYNGDFREIKDNPNQGRVLLYFREDEFPQPGEYEMTVTAGDYLKNRTQSKFILDVKSLAKGLYDIGDFYAYPSPAHLGESTRFYFNAPQGNVHRMTLKIFTLSGQLIRQFNDVRPGVAWDLTDQTGNRLSPNVYLYRLYVERDGRPEMNSINSKGEKEIIRSEIGKMAIYPPR